MCDGRVTDIHSEIKRQGRAILLMVQQSCTTSHVWNPVNNGINYHWRVNWCRPDFWTMNRALKEPKGKIQIPRYPTGNYAFSHNHGSVENYPKWKETSIGGTLEGPMFHFHDYGREGNMSPFQISNSLLNRWFYFSPSGIWTNRSLDAILSAWKLHPWKLTAGS